MALEALCSWIFGFGLSKQIRKMHQQKVCFCYVAVIIARKLCERLTALVVPQRAHHTVTLVTLVQYIIHIAYLFHCDYVMLTNNGHFITMQCVRCDCAYPLSLLVVLRRHQHQRRRCRCRRLHHHCLRCIPSAITSTRKYLLAISKWEWG